MICLTDTRLDKTLMDSRNKGVRLIISILRWAIGVKKAAVGRMGRNICPSDLSCRRSDVAVGHMGSIADGQ